MTLKIWRGDAPEVAQVSRLTPSAVEIGDTFTLTCNGKSITVTATAATVANVVALFVAAISATIIPEFQEITAEADTDNGSVLLTANTAGVPFVVTVSAVNGGSGGVVVVETVKGAVATSPASAVLSFAIPRAGTANADGTAAGTFTVYHLGNASSAIAVGASAATVQTALEAISSIGAGNATVAKTDLSPHGILFTGEFETYTVTFTGTLANSAQTLTATMNSVRPIARWVTRPIGSTTLGVIEIDFTGSGTTFESAVSNTKQYTLSWHGLTTPGGGNVLTMDFEDWQVGERIMVYLSLGDGSWIVTYSGAKMIITAAVNPSWVQLITANNVTGLGTNTANLTVTVITAGSSGTAAVNEVQTVTLATAPTGGTFTLNFSGQTTSAIAFDASAATVDAALEALSNIGAGDVAVTGSAGGPWTVTFGSALAGVDQPLLVGNGASLTGGVVQGLALAAVTASSGPNHWDTAANWLPSGVPITGDDVRFEIGNSDCLYGIDQTGVTLATLHIAMTWTGKMGLPRKNRNDYLEYRAFELTCGITSLLVGYGEGSGPGKVAINTLAVQTAIEVRGSGGSSDVGIPAVTWRGSHASNVVTVLDGEFGTAPYSDQSATIYDLLQRGGSVALRHTAVTNQAIYTRQLLSTYDCTLGGQVWEA